MTSDGFVLLDNHLHLSYAIFVLAFLLLCYRLVVVSVSVSTESEGLTDAAYMAGLMDGWVDKWMVMWTDD